MDREPSSRLAFTSHRKPVISAENMQSWPRVLVQKQLPRDEFLIANDFGPSISSFKPYLLEYCSRPKTHMHINILVQKQQPLLFFLAENLTISLNYHRIHHLFPSSNKFLKILPKSSSVLYIIWIDLPILLTHTHNHPNLLIFPTENIQNH